MNKVYILIGIVFLVLGILGLDWLVRLAIPTQIYPYLLIVAGLFFLYIGLKEKKEKLPVVEEKLEDKEEKK